MLAGTAYLCIAAMTATSFDRTAAWLGPRKWRLLHLVGGWYIWISFAVAVGKRVPQGPIYGPDGAGARRGDRPAGRDVTPEPPGEGGYRLRRQLLRHPERSKA